MVSEMSCHFVGYRVTLSQAARLIPKKGSFQKRRIPKSCSAELESAGVRDRGDASIKSSALNPVGPEFDGFETAASTVKTSSQARSHE
jgi:hypothetical protein